MTKSEVSALVSTYFSQGGRVTYCPTRFALHSPQVSKRTLEKVAVENQFIALHTKKDYTTEELERVCARYMRLHAA